ncbi:MAG: 3-hydroxyacyl-CoA dehydrogenase family protein [Candidatus Micrarchaeota archaeon]
MKIGIIGTGVMGVGISTVFLQNDFETIVFSRSKESAEKAEAKIKKNLEKALGEKAGEAVKKLSTTNNLQDLMQCDFIIESIIEDFYEKRKLLSELKEFQGILCTNTSSLSVSKLSEYANEKFVGMHFFNPAHKMKLVEIVAGDTTPTNVINKTRELAEKIGKTPITVKDSPGFVVNRLLMPFLNEAILTLEDGVASREEIDSAAQLGLNHPMGPLKLLDLIGLDVFLAIMNSLFEQTSEEKFKPAELAVKMVSDGKLGIKTKQGFYSYE